MNNTKNYIFKLLIVFLLIMITDLCILTGYQLKGYYYILSGVAGSIMYFMYSSSSYINLKGEK